MTTQSQKENGRDTSPGYVWRRTVALAISAMVIAYAAAVVLGLVPAERKIDAVTLAMIVGTAVVVVLLLRPEVFDRLKLVEMTGFKLEMLEKVRQKQAQQASQLEDIALMLPLLLSGPERRHLLNLGSHTTTGYQGNHAVRTELRRLRSIGLIRMLRDRQGGAMKEGLAFNLADYVELTDLGKAWIRRITEIEKTDSSNEA